MTMMTAKQSNSSATFGDVSFAARAFSAILLIPGAVLAAPLFVSLHGLAGLLILSADLLSAAFPIPYCPRRELGTS